MNRCDFCSKYDPTVGRCVSSDHYRTDNCGEAIKIQMKFEANKQRSQKTRTVNINRQVNKKHK